jgi:serine protease Do
MAKTWQSALACVAVGALTVAGAPPALAQDGGPDPTTASVQERVIAEVLPGVNLLSIGVSGFWLTAEGATPVELPASPSCTGFTVNPNGYVATAGHCVDPEVFKEDLAKQEAASAAAFGQDEQAVFEDLIFNSTLEGITPGSPPVFTVTVQRAQADGSAPSAPMPAQIVDFKPLTEGDVALLKVNATNLPSIEVAPSTGVNPGTPIISVGYPGVVDDAVVAPNLSPTWKDGAVSRMLSLPGSGVPTTEITAEMGGGMSGGPTVNHEGQVIGINSWGIDDGGSSFNFVAPSSTLSELMARNGVRAESGPVDQAYRAGLEEYYSGQYSDAQRSFERAVALQPEHRQAAEFRTKALQAYERFGDRGLGVLGWSLIGGAVLLVLVAGLVTLLLVRRRRRRAPTPDGGSGPPQGSGPAPAAYGPPSTPYPAAQPYPTTPSRPMPTQRTSDAHAHRVGAATRGDTQAGGRPTARSAAQPNTVVTGQPGRVGPGRPPTAGVPPAGGAASPALGKTTKYCRQCGAPRAENARFCDQCGAGAS